MFAAPINFFKECIHSDEHAATRQLERVACVLMPTEIVRDDCSQTVTIGVTASRKVPKKFS